MIWIVEKVKDGLHDKLFRKLKNMAEIGEPEMEELDRFSENRIYLIYDANFVEELIENVNMLFRNNDIIEIMKDSKEALLIFNLISPFAYGTFEFAIVKPGQKIVDMIEELLFDLFTYSDLWLLDLGIDDPVQIYFNKDELKKVFDSLEIRYVDDVAIIEKKFIN